MHSIVLLTAMTATSGLFGGHHKQARTAGCQGGSCARPAAVAYAPSGNCSTGQCGTPSYGGHASYAPAPQHRATAYTSNYYPPASSSCATGNCPRR